MATGGSNVARALLAAAGLVYVVAALLYDPHLLALVTPGELAPLTLEKVRGVRAVFGAAGAALLGLAWLAPRTRVLASWLARERVAVWLLAVLGLALPLSLLDCGLRPFVEPKTTVYVADEALGWKLKPGHEDEYGGVRVAINAKGLRGPELAFEKPPESFRILWLGDSVTFGYGVEAVDALFPYRVAALLAPRIGRAVESVDAGVGGYSPWQERTWLESDGWRYAPDLVVVGFVLNDLTEPLSLVRYGGRGEGWQLARSARGVLDRWLSASALATAMRDGVAAVRFGRDVQHGAAIAEAGDVLRLVTQPRAPLWRKSWHIAETNLAQIFAAARERGVGAALIVFPYAFQLDAPQRTAGPQRRLVAFAQAQGVPVLDLLPLLAARRDASLFLDGSHLSERGHEVVSDLVAAFLLEHALLPASAARDQ
ncbi:MAG TPA: SGNH/GDSL hydrolase family protein [Myxococcota bacterium]|nr:SGNH/GDSL hydrolase family protein [Myxococcota bacterium]